MTDFPDPKLSTVGPSGRARSLVLVISCLFIGIAVGNFYQEWKDAKRRELGMVVRACDPSEEFLQVARAVTAIGDVLQHIARVQSLEGAARERLIEELDILRERLNAPPLGTPTPAPGMRREPVS